MSLFWLQWSRTWVFDLAWWALTFPIFTTLSLCWPATSLTSSSSPHFLLGRGDRGCVRVRLVSREGEGEVFTWSWSPAPLLTPLSSVHSCYRRNNQQCINHCKLTAQKKKNKVSALSTLMNRWVNVSKVAQMFCCAKKKLSNFCFNFMVCTVWPNYIKKNLKWKKYCTLSQTNTCCSSKAETKTTN